jgi:hypothetical protein
LQGFSDGGSTPPASTIFLFPLCAKPLDPAHRRVRCCGMPQ